MGSSPSRRDLLKAMGSLPLSMSLAPLLRSSDPRQAADGSQNVLIVVFDAFSARNASLYGYPRETTPNISRLAERAIVYHNHYSAGDWTAPGTASLLTAALPWTHEALGYRRRVTESFVTRNIFTAFRDYHRLTYTHNPIAFTLLRQLGAQIDDLIPRGKLLLPSGENLVEAFFPDDAETAAVSWSRAMNVHRDGFAYSLLASQAYEALQRRRFAKLEPYFPYGVPSSGADDAFLLDQNVDWLAEELATVPKPFLAYLHFLPPHSPYRTSIEFFERFKDDGYQPPVKPVSILGGSPIRQAEERRDRQLYDEYILYVDQQFARFFDRLEASGLLERTWLILTSDHGEMHERGFLHHGTTALYDPVIWVPLLIFEPGRKTRLDVRTVTSSVDLLSTLTTLTGHAKPEWSEGRILPPFDPVDHGDAPSAFAVQTNRFEPGQPMPRGSVVMFKGFHKLHYYFGYKALRGKDYVELYDLRADPEELVDLSTSERKLTDQYVAELKARMRAANQTPP